MQKLFEIFKVSQFQKRIVAAALYMRKYGNYFLQNQFFRFFVQKMDPFMLSLICMERTLVCLFLKAILFNCTYLDLIALHAA